MKVILTNSITEIEIKKSKFICHVKPVNNEELAKEFVSEIRKLHRKATHNVPIYLIGRNYEIQKYSDDGEPSGTAGLPVLRMIKNEELTDLAIVITRYFGGIKLGKGGLVRAYTSVAKKGIEAAGMTEVLHLVLLKFDLDYKIQSKFLHLLENNFKYFESNVEYGNMIRYTYYIPIEEVEYFKKCMVELTSGSFSLLEERAVGGIVVDGKIEEVTCIEKY